jgi:Fic family protein
MHNLRRMSQYFHHLKTWPEFWWDHELLLMKLADVRNRQGRLLGRMEALGFEMSQEAFWQTLSEDVLRSSEIEGELYNTDEVRSSVARKLGLEFAGMVHSGRDVDGMVDVLADATQDADQPLTKDRLHSWHAALFPTGRSGLQKITVGAFRKGDAGPMQVVSGAMGFERVHYVAPEADRLEAEMDNFLNWFNADQNIDPVLKAAVAHLWFVSVHPYDDGNGRLARAVADMQLSRADGSNKRFYSMSSQIMKVRKSYYEILEQTQKGDLDVTKWMLWFLECMQAALQNTEVQLARVLTKANFWERHKMTLFNERQLKMVNCLLDDFEGKLTTTKWAKMQKCSQDTALRDVNDLLEKGVLEKDPAGGRSSSYLLKV